VLCVHSLYDSSNGCRSSFRSCAYYRMRHEKGFDRGMQRLKSPFGYPLGPKFVNDTIFLRSEKKKKKKKKKKTQQRKACIINTDTIDVIVCVRISIIFFFFT
jgi:hypothetical protein